MAEKSCGDCANVGYREISGRDDQYCRRVGYATCFARQSLDEPIAGHCGPEARHFKSSGERHAER